MIILNIFVLPQEIKRLVDFLQNIIKNRTYITSIDFSENSESFSNNFEDIIGSSNEIKKIIEYAKKAAENKTIKYS